MTAYLYQAPSIVPGDITRTDGSSVEPAMLVSPFPSNYGVPMKYAPGPGSSGTGITPMVAADVAASFAGILARAVPGISQNSQAEQTNTFQPNQAVPQGLCKRGYIGVNVNAGVPVRGQPVFLVVVASAGHPAGTFETTDNGGNNIPLTNTLVGNVTWASDGVDANSNGEVRIAQ